MAIPTRKLVSLSPELSNNSTLNCGFLQSIEWYWSKKDAASL